MSNAVVDDVLAAYDLERVGEPQLVAAGTLNWNYRVETSSGIFFVRRHREESSLERTIGEHQVIAFAAEHGIPVVQPIENDEATTALIRNGAVWAVFPWVDGHPPVRGAITAAQAYALGEMHGRIHAAFAGHSASAGAQFSMRWDKAESLAILDRVAVIARERAVESKIQQALAYQRSVLEESHIEPPSYFASLPCQLSHGDYHDQQVLFDDAGRIAAVTDWEIYQANARVWEVIRSLAFSGLLHTTEMADYLRGYRQNTRLTPEECRLGVQLWWQSRINGVWVWAAYFLQGNERVAGFLSGVVSEIDSLGSTEKRDALTVRLLDAAT